MTVTVEAPVRDFARYAHRIEFVDYGVTDSPDDVPVHVAYQVDIDGHDVTRLMPHMPTYGANWQVENRFGDFGEPTVVSLRFLAPALEVTESAVRIVDPIDGHPPVDVMVPDPPEGEGPVRYLLLAAGASRDVYQPEDVMPCGIVRAWASSVLFRPANDAERARSQRPVLLGDV